MQRKRKITLYVEIIIFLMFFFSALVNIIGSELPIQYAVLIALVSSAFITLLAIIWFRMIIFSIAQPIKMVNQIRRLQNAKYIDSNDYDYVRDVPSKYSPALASLLLDQSIEHNKDVIATTLYLINHGYLQEKNGIISVTNIQIDNLMEHESYLIEIYQKKLPFSSLVWHEKILNDAFKNNLVTNKGEVTKKDNIRLAINLIAPIILFIILVNLMSWIGSTDNVILNILYVIVMIMLPNFGFSIFIYEIVYLASFVSKRIKLTNNGLKEQEKMAKFKRFLMDFSNIEKRKTEEIVLWEDYLTFAVALGINNQIYWDNNFRRKVNTIQGVVQMEVLNELSKIGS